MQTAAIGPDPVVLGIDIGSTNTKAALVAVGAGPATELRAHRVATPRGGRDLLAAVDEVVHAVLGGDRGAAPRAVGVASMAETGIPLDRGGAPLGDLVRWDRRTASADPDLPRRAAHFAATGVALGPKTPLTMWRELRAHDPERWRAMVRWAGVADLVVLHLTGRLVTDHTLAGRTGAYRLPPHGAPLPAGFDETLLAEAGLADAGLGSRLPDVVRPGDAAGGLLADRARAWGADPGIPVVVAGHDHAVAAWGAGVRAPGAAADSIGTTEALVRVLDGPVDRDAAYARGMSVLRAVDGERESVLAGTTGAGALVAEWSRLMLREGDAGLGDELAETTGVTVLPYPAGRQSPRPDPRARLRILDEHGGALDPRDRPRAELDRALLEAMCRQLRWMDEEQRALVGGPPEPLRVLGGAAGANRRWLELKGELLPVPLEVAEAREPVASAAAVRAAVVAGIAPASARLAVRPHSAGTASPDHRFAAFIAAAQRTDHATHDHATHDQRGDPA